MVYVVHVSVDDWDVGGLSDDYPVFISAASLKQAKEALTPLRNNAEEFLRAEATKISNGVSEGHLTGEGGMTLVCQIYDLPSMEDGSDDDDEVTVVFDQSLRWDLEGGFIEAQADIELTNKELREWIAA